MSSSTDCRVPPDEELVLGVASGLSSALAGLYDRYGRRAYGLARRICGDEGLAEDVVREAFLAFWRAPQRFDTQHGSFSVWILTSVHHKSVDAIRRTDAVSRRTVPEPGPEWPAVPAPGVDGVVDRWGALRAAEGNEVRDAWSRLPAEQRHALALTYFGGYTQREVATLTGMPMATVKAQMSIGLRRMHASMGPPLGDVIPDTRW